MCSATSGFKGNTVLVKAHLLKKQMITQQVCQFLVPAERHHPISHWVDLHDDSELCKALKSHGMPLLALLAHRRPRARLELSALVCPDVTANKCGERLGPSLSPARALLPYMGYNCSSNSFDLYSYQTQCGCS